MPTKITLLVIISLALCLRLYHLDSYGIFYDEKATLLISQGVCMDGGANQLAIFSQPTFTPQDFWKTKTIADFNESITRGDIGNSPAYYGVLMLWEKVFGLTDFSIRSLSVFFSIAFILLLFIFVKTHWQNEKLAILACILAAIEPFFIAYSHQARNYSMSFFLTLLATHLFLLIAKNEKLGQAKYWLYACYGVVCGLCLLSHFLTFTVFLGHGLYVLLFVRKLRTWFLLPLSLLIGLGMMGIWMTKGGGQYTLRSLDGQAKFYYDIAHAKPNLYAGFIDPAEPKIVLKKTIPILADLSVFSNGLGNTLVGIRNLVLALLAGIGLIFTLNFYQKKQFVWLGFLPTILLLGCYFMFTLNKWSFLELSIFIVLIYLLFKYYSEVKTQETRQLLVLLGLMSVIPTLILVVFSFKNGHTFGLTPRYQGFAFPYAIILASIALSELWKLNNLFKIPIFAVILGQFIYVSGVIQQIYSDTSVKYCQFGTPRTKNPHYEIAQNIKKIYKTGDTLIYPSFTGGTYSELENRQISYLDAQMVNVYLPKDAQYLQKMNPKEPNKVILKRNDGTVLELFDFKGKTYRY